MIRRVVALSLVLGLASVAQGAVNVELIQNGSTVEVYLSQDEATPHLLRLVEFRFGATDPALTVSGFQWDIGAAGHYKDEDLAGGPDGVAVAYALMAEDAGAQATLPATGSSLKVGSFQVTCPDPGDPEYVLDVLDPGQVNGDFNATVSYGFGMVLGDDITYLNPPGGMTGGNIMFQCVAEATYVEMQPADTISLWRTQMNIVRLKFDRSLAAAPTPGSGELKIEQMLAGPATGADQAAAFAFALDGAGDILKITENMPKDPTVLPHRTWWRLINDGSWAGVAPFEIQLVVQVGDVNNDGLVLGNDGGIVNGAPTPGVPDDDRRDIDGNTLILGNDGGLVNGKVPSPPVPKPAGW